MTIIKLKNNTFHKHGLSKHPLYSAFNSAKQRSTNPNNPRYETCCGRWLFTETVGELSEMYLPMYSRVAKENPCEKIALDRIDNDKGYRHGNVQFLTEEQHKMKSLKERSSYIMGEEWKKKISKANKGKHGKKVKQFAKNGSFIKEWKSMTQASEYLKISQSSISKCCRGVSYKTVGGYKWTFSK